MSKRTLDIYKARFERMAVEQGNKGIDWDRGYIVQVARFDPSKGFDDLVEAYRLFRARVAEEHPEQRCPQLILVGAHSFPHE